MKINKITTGFVIQTYDTELNKWTGQEFIAGTQTEYEAGTNRILNPAEVWPDSTEPYLPFIMQQPVITQTQSPSPGLPTAFDCYEIHGIKEFEEAGNKFCEQVPDDEAEFWCLFGHIPGAGLMDIGDFNTRAQAEEILARIIGCTERKENINANGTHYR